MSLKLNSLGVYAGLAAAISYAGYVILSDRFQKNIHPLTSSFYVMLSAGVTLAFIYRPEFHHFFGPDYSNLKLFVGLSVFGTIAPLSLFLAGLQRIPGPQASILVMIEPIIASILAYFVFSEAMSLGQIVGISLVVLADIIIVRLK